MRNSELTRSYTTRLQKAGAAIEDSRILLRHWSDAIPTEKLTDKLVSENVLGKASRMRMKDVIIRVFVPRFVRGEPKDAWRYLQTLEVGGTDGDTMASLLYFHTARSEKILYDFMVEEVYPRFMVGHSEIGVDDAVKFISEVVPIGTMERWTDTVSLKVARGMLAALRDFGILEGKVKKQIKATYLSPTAFAIIAFLVHTKTKSGERIINADDWKLYLLSPEVVERKLFDAHQLGFLTYKVAGNIKRIDFPYKSVEEMAHELAG